MNKGYILSLSLMVLMISSFFLSYKISVNKSLIKISEGSDKVYLRLKNEKEILDEILFRLSLYDSDNFEYLIDDITYVVEINEEEVNILVNELNKYEIKLKYSDDCICFIEILYK